LQVVVHESTLADDFRELAVGRGHSTPSMAAAFAKEVKAPLLVLTHFSGRYCRELPQAQATGDREGSAKYVVRAPVSE
jgi:ribonuclease BN (tRNA processing enzyme)